MTLEQQGAYMRLLSHCWLNGSIPGDVADLALLCHTSPDQMAQLWPRIAPCFSDNGDGRLVNERLDDEREKQAKYKERATIAGKASAKARRKLDVSSTKRQLKSNTAFASPVCISEEEYPPAGQLDRNHYPSQFESVWSAYPQRGGGNPKRAAYQAWRTRVMAGTDPDELHAGTQRYATYVDLTGAAGTEYVMQASRFYGPDESWTEEWAPPTAGRSRIDDEWDALLAVVERKPGADFGALSPTAHAALEAIGGLSELRQTKTDRLGWKRKEFANEYKARFTVNIGDAA